MFEFTRDLYYASLRARTWPIMCQSLIDAHNKIVPFGWNDEEGFWTTSVQSDAERLRAEIADYGQGVVNGRMLFESTSTGIVRLSTGAIAGNAHLAAWMISKQIIQRLNSAVLPENHQALIAESSEPPEYLTRDDGVFSEEDAPQIDWQERERLIEPLKRKDWQILQEGKALANFPEFDALELNLLVAREMNLLIERHRPPWIDLVVETEGCRFAANGYDDEYRGRPGHWQWEQWILRSAASSLWGNGGPKKDELPKQNGKTEERDKWLYDMACHPDKITYDEIQRQLAKLCSEHQWDGIETGPGCRDRAFEYAKRHEIDPPPSRQGKS